MSTGSSAADTGRVSRPGVIAVWDPLVRIFHWSLAGIIAFEFLGEDGDALHRTLGYVALGLIAFRIIWGFAGPRHHHLPDLKAPNCPHEPEPHDRRFHRRRRPDLVPHRRL